jgi:thiol-disulfide isomerase/thioredoxin
MKSRSRALLFAALLASFAARAQAPRPAPDVGAQTLDGRPFSLASLRGRFVLLDFWASWCAPCRESFPFFDRLREKWRAQGLEVVGLTLEESRDAATSFLESVPVAFPIAHDPSGTAGEAFHVVAMPTAFLINREGLVVARFEGGGRKVHRRIESAVAAVIGGRPLPEDVDVLAPQSARATGELKAWQRGFLADPMMNLSGSAVDALLHEHIHASKEAAAGDGGPAGGGCGCN